MDANVKCVQNKSIVVQQEDKCVPQDDMRSDMMIDLSINSSGRTYPSVTAVQNFSLESDFEKTKVNEVLSNDCLKFEHEPFGDVTAHTMQDKNGQCHNHLQTRDIIESKKEVVAADSQSKGAYFVQQEHEETSSQVQILRADIPISSMPFSSAICGEIKCCNVIDNCDMHQGGESVSLQDLEYVSTPTFRVAYNLNEKRDQMFCLREDLEKK
jgi:hypothetical protein